MSTHPLEFRLLADENIHPEVVAHLRTIGYDIVTVYELGFGGKTDESLLQYTVENERVILTHDSDFGTLAIRQGATVFGIIYLRPGHIKPDFTIESVTTMAKQSLTVDTPFVVVVHRQQNKIRVRSRQL